MTKNETTRIYAIPDSEMLQESKIMQGLFISDKDAFANFDPGFADPFNRDWAMKFTNAGNVIRDEFYEADLKEKTKVVQDNLDAAKNHFQKLKYFAEKAFPNNPEKLNQFGAGDYDNARRSEVKMIQFLGLVYITAQQYKDRLISVGFSEDEIEKIKTIQASLSTADLEQEKLKKERPAYTQDRIKLLNECYEYMQKVSRAAKIIFADNYAKYNQYLLPNERVSKKENPEEQQEVPANQQG